MEQRFIDNVKETLEIDDRDIVMSDKFREYPEWDSLAYLSMLVMLDEEYNTQIEGNEFKQLFTLADLYNAINK